MYTSRTYICEPLMRLWMTMGDKKKWGYEMINQSRFVKVP